MRLKGPSFCKILAKSRDVKSPLIISTFFNGLTSRRSIAIIFRGLFNFSNNTSDQLPGAAPRSTAELQDFSKLYFLSISSNL